MSNDYFWWSESLAGRRGPISPGEPMSGFYRVRDRRDGSYKPVAFWRDQQGQLLCRLGDRMLDETSALELWPFASKEPVAKDICFAAFKGVPWPDQNQAVLRHNRAPAAEDLETIEDRLEDLARDAQKLIDAGAAKDQDAADHASDLANSFGELEAKADKLRAEEKAPHLEAGRQVDLKWRPLIDRAGELKRKLKLIVVTPFLTRKAEETRTAQLASVAGGASIEDMPVARITAGSSKRSTALRTTKRAEVTDWDALLGHLKEHPEIRNLALSIANAAAKKNLALPGCRIVAEQVAA